jgi:hypothetical protein
VRHGAVAFSRGVQPSVYALLAVRLTDLFCDEPSLFPQPEGQLSSGNSSAPLEVRGAGHRPYRPGLGGGGTLYVADTLGNRIAAIPNARLRFASGGAGRTVSQGGGLNGPLGLAIAPNGNVLVVNSPDGNLVEVAPGGTQFPPTTIDTSTQGAGTLFGAVKPQSTGVYFVDDGDNTLDLLH